MDVATVVAIYGGILMSTQAIITPTSSNTDNRQCETYNVAPIDDYYCQTYYRVYSRPCRISINVSGFSVPPYLSTTLNAAPHLQHVNYLFHFNDNSPVSDFLDIWRLSSKMNVLADYLVRSVQMFPLTGDTVCIIIHPYCMRSTPSTPYGYFCYTGFLGEQEKKSTARLTSWLFSAKPLTLLFEYNRTELSIINQTCYGNFIVPTLYVPPETKILNTIYTNCTINLCHDTGDIWVSNPWANIVAVNLTGSESTVTKLLFDVYPFAYFEYCVFESLLSLDISHSNLISAYRRGAVVVEETRSSGFSFLQKFYARNCVPFSCSFHTTSYGHVSCIEVRISNSSFLTDVICIPPKTLELLDISENKIDYIDISFTDVFTSLKILHISGNLLKTVRLYGGGDINLSQMTKLTELYCSNNKLKTLGTDIFDLSPYLTVIDLSFNTLTTITFRVKHLNQLRSLNLYKNAIKFFEPSFMSEKLTSLVIYQKTHSNTTIEINLVENPLICKMACASKAAVAWLLQHENEIKFSPMSCELEHNSRIINELTLDTINKMCNRPIYVGLASTITAVFFIIAALAFCRYRLGLRRERQLLNLIQKFKDARRDRFPVFLSFCSSNADFVMDNVFEELNRRLQELLGTNRRCVAFGDANFRPGAVVVEEMVRCISRCDVVIVCVSNTFLRSPWCTDEVRITHFQRKPIILMFLEEVDMKLLIKSILILYFMRSCRAKWIKLDGSFKLQPEWDVFCRSVVSHMDEDAADSDEDETIV